MNLEFGKYAIQVKQVHESNYIYDIVRRKWVRATPEEEVRQLWLHYLHTDKGYSVSKIAVEKGFYINNRLKRFDICVYDLNAQPYILIECKAPSQKLNTAAVEQMARYNLHLGAKLFIVTNGIHHHVFAIYEDGVKELETF